MDYKYICKICNYKIIDDSRILKNKEFINNLLCVNCFENNWECNFCKIKVNQYDGSFYNNKLCYTCYRVKFPLMHPR